MINYYLNLLDNKITRFYFTASFLAIIINVIIFEIIYLIASNTLFLNLIIILSIVFFFFNSLVQNIRDQYVLNYLYTVNVKKTTTILKTINLSEVNSWSPNELHQMITHGNFAIDNLITLVENIFYFAIKLFVSLIITIFYKSNLSMLFSISSILIAVNLYLLFNNKYDKNFIILDKLHNYFYYASHNRLSYLTDFFQEQFKKIVLSISPKNNTSFIYLNFACIAIYLLLNYNGLSLTDKFYVVMYARNSSYLFTLIQNIINNFENVQKNSTQIDKLVSIPKKKKVKQNTLDFDYVITIKKLSYLENHLDKNIILKPSDKIILHGESGVGKSTLFSIMKGISEPNKIDIELNSSQLLNHFHHIESNILLIKYDTFKFFNESIKEFIIEDYEHDNDLLNYLIDLTEMNTICADITKILNNQNISSGQMRRLVIIKAFYQLYMGNYKILLLDEVDNGIHQDLFLKILTDLFSSTYYKDKLVIMISHNKELHLNDVLFNHKIEISKDKIRWD